MTLAIMSLQHFADVCDRCRAVLDIVEGFHEKPVVREARTDTDEDFPSHFKSLEDIVQSARAGCPLCALVMKDFEREIDEQCSQQCSQCNIGVNVHPGGQHHSCIMFEYWHSDHRDLSGAGPQVYVQFPAGEQLDYSRCRLY
jgi:hypothetical protein